MPIDNAKLVISYKGFNKDLKCRDHQFKVGETYKHDGNVKVCSSGFHACEYPLDVFGYYNPADSRYALVEQSGDMSREDADSKVASSILSIKAELTIANLVKASIDFVMGKIDHKIEQTVAINQSAATNTGNYSAATNTGYQSAATNTGNYSVATNTGYQSAATNTGYQSAATNTGYQSAATNTGNYSAATNTGNYSVATNTGNYSAATNTGNYSVATNTGYQSAATNTGNYSAATNTGYQSAATNTGNYSVATNTGNYSAATNTGYQSAATNTGDKSAATIEGSAKESVACGLGYQSKAKASKGNWIVLAFRDDEYKIKKIVSAQAGVTKGVKADVFYTLSKTGKFVEVKQ